MLQKAFINGFKKKGSILFQERENIFCFFLCFSFQTRKDLPLVKIYNATIRHFLKTFRKFTVKRLWWRLFLGKFQFFKWTQPPASPNSFGTLFYGRFQILFGLKIPNSSKVCQTLVVFSYNVSLNTQASNFFILFMCKFHVFFFKYSSQKVHGTWKVSS